MDSAIKQEIKTETGEPAKEQAAAPSDATDKKPPVVETEDVKSSSKGSKKDHGAKKDSHGDSDSSATCSADEVEETDNTEKSRLEPLSQVKVLLSSLRQPIRPSKKIAPSDMNPLFSALFLSMTSFSPLEVINVKGPPLSEQWFSRCPTSVVYQGRHQKKAANVLKCY